MILIKKITQYIMDIIEIILISLAGLVGIIFILMPPSSSNKQHYSLWQRIKSRISKSVQDKNAYR